MFGEKILKIFFKKTKNLFFYAFFVSLIFDPIIGMDQNKQPVAKDKQTLTEWSNVVFKTCPDYPNQKDKTPLSYEKLYQILMEYNKKEKEYILLQKNWYREEKTLPLHYAIKKDVYSFTKENPTKIFVVGDHHGCIHSMLRNLWRLVAAGYLKNDFKMKDNFYMVFLGDYIDRGLYGAEVIYTLCRLKLANPDNVFILRGNHETRNCEGESFSEELSTKYGKERGTLLYDLILDLF
jgi:hypothetical protein